MSKSTASKTTMKKSKSDDKSKKMTSKTFETAKKRRQVFLRSKIKAAERFSVVARQKLGNLCKAVVVIGSLVRDDFKPGSDIDILVVLDDTHRDVPDELKEKLLAMLNELGRKIDKKMQVQIHTLTEMFQFAKEGDNIIYNFLRHSKIVYDGGMFKPLKNLLKAGEIKPSKESVMRSMEGADFYMKKVNQYVEWILERYYRAITWAGNAYFMAMGEKPASVPEIPILLKKHADKGELPQEIPMIAAEVIKKFKAVEHEEEKPDMKTIYELLPKVNAYLDSMRKDVLGSIMGDTLKGTMKAKIKTMPKIIFEFEKGRAFVWLLDNGVYLANYDNEKLTKVYKSKINDGQVDSFKATKNEKLFEAMETSDLKPLINIDLIKMIHKALPDAVKRDVKKVAIEYPGRAMIDLGTLSNKFYMRLSNVFMKDNEIIPFEERMKRWENYPFQQMAYDMSISGRINASIGANSWLLNNCTRNNEEKGRKIPKRFIEDGFPLLENSDGSYKKVKEIYLKSPDYVYWLPSNFRDLKGIEYLEITTKNLDRKGTEELKAGLSNFENLKYLTITSFSGNINELIESFNENNSIEYFVYTGNSSEFAIPGNRYQEFEESQYKELFNEKFILTEDIKKLKNIKELVMMGLDCSFYSNLTILPDVFQNFNNINKIDFSDTKVKYLPKSLCEALVKNSNKENSVNFRLGTGLLSYQNNPTFGEIGLLDEFGLYFIKYDSGSFREGKVFKKGEYSEII